MLYVATSLVGVSGDSVAFLGLVIKLLKKIKASRQVKSIVNVVRGLVDACLIIVL